MPKGNSSSRETTSEVTEQRTIPVSTEVRNRVRELKGNKTYNELISEWAREHAAKN